MTEVELEIDAREHITAKADRYGLTPDEVAEVRREIDCVREAGEFL